MVADQLYSLSLLAALSAAVFAAISAAGLFVQRRLPVSKDRLTTLARRGGLSALAFGLLSVAVHFAFGHRPGTAEALGPMAFFAVHPAFLVVFALAVVAVAASRLECPSRCARRRSLGRGR